MPQDAVSRTTDASWWVDLPNVKCSQGSHTQNARVLFPHRRSSRLSKTVCCAGLASAGFARGLEIGREL